MLDLKKPLLILMTGIILLIVMQINFERWMAAIKKKTDIKLDLLMEELDLMFIRWRRQQVDLVIMGTASMLTLSTLVLVWPHFYIAIGTFFIYVNVCYSIPLNIIRGRRASRMIKFTEQMVDALTLMANGMRAGLNINQAMGMVKNEMKDPIREEFTLVLQQNQVGASLEDAFAAMARRLPCDDVEMFVTSVNILKETGGNLAETFDTISNTIRGRIKLASKISAMVQQGVVQATIVFCMPFGLGAVLYITDPVTMTPMFTKPLGWGFLGLMLTLQIIGGIALKKIITIEV